MKLETFFEKFDLFADAPDAVAKLRQLVLCLAVRGKLVPQDPNDEPAFVSATHPLNGAFEVPSGWAWIRLEDLQPEFQNGASSRGDKDGVPIVVIRLADVASRRVVLNDPRTIAISTDQISKYRLESGDTLITRVNGSADIVGTFIPIQESLDAIYCDHFIRMRIDPTRLSPAYTALVGDSQLVREQIRSLFITTAGQKTVNQGHIRSLSVPLPPLAEQHRIVAKVDELMALCDRLEAQQQDRESRERDLARAALARFAEAPTPANLDLLFHSAFGIPPSDLRKSILTLAVQGKLVPQDPNNEPAPVLLEQIAAYKAVLAQKGELRGSTAVSPMNVDEAEADLPATWVWVRFGEIMINRDGERIPVSREERETKAKTYDYYGASGVIDKIDAYLFDKPLLLIGEDGANLLSRSTPIAFIARGKYWVNNHAHVLDGISEDFLQYVALYINAINLEPYVTGTAQPKMNQAKMNSIPIALPPLAEQARIVAKVDELMALVDQLEAQQTAARTTAETLLEAAVAELGAT